MRVGASSEDSGSSSSSNRGLRMMALARAALCCCPPDSSRGKSIFQSAKLKAFQKFTDKSALGLWDAVCDVLGHGHKRGTKRIPGTGIRSAVVAVAASYRRWASNHTSSAQAIRPDSGRSNPARHRKIVVLPHPTARTKPWNNSRRSPD